MAAPGQTTWKVIDACEFRWRIWDNQFVVYNPASGDTHLLNQVAGEALRCLQEAPADAAELTRRVAVRTDIQVDAQLLAKINDFLDELAELGLIELVPS